MTRHRAEDPRLDQHPLVRAADALVRAVLAATNRPDIPGFSGADLANLGENLPPVSVHARDQDSPAPLLGGSRDALTRVVAELVQQESISLARLRELVSAAPRGAAERDVVVSGAAQNTPAGDLVGERRTD